MADLLSLHLFQPSQWKEAERSHLLFDKKVSDWSIEACSPETICRPILEFFTETVSLQILFGIIVAFFIWKATRHLRSLDQMLLIAFLGACIALGDFFSNQLKYVFSRPRPDQDLALIEAGMKTSFSFPSNHAFNLFGFALLLWLLYRKGHLRGVKIPIALSLIALLVSISRVFAGRHYPIDIVGGLIFGSIFAYLSLGIATKIRATYKAR